MFACIGKPKSEKRCEFEKKVTINENKITIDAYNNLSNILNIKNRQFEQNLFNTFLEDQTLRAKQDKSFDINSCKELIKKSTNPKRKQKFNVVIDKVNEVNVPVKDNKPVLKTKHSKSLTRDIYPKAPTFTMKFIAARGMGKIIFLIPFLHSLINRGVVKHEDVYNFCPTLDNQDQWRSSGFTARNFSFLNEEYAKGKLLVFDDPQIDAKRNKLIEMLYVTGRHNRTGIIQSEQFTQATAHIEKGNSNFFVLIPPVNECPAQYYHEHFMPTLTSKNTWKLGLLAEEKACKEDNPELRYLIINKFGDINMGYKYRVCPFEDGNYALVETNYIGINIKPIIDIEIRYYSI